MWVILLEALAALFLLVFIVWWTMFSGRRGGERSSRSPNDQGPVQRSHPDGTPPTGPS